jgi:2-dehydropantoate 2-reductase
VSGAKSILVAGCGAVGSVFACLLAEAGHRVDALVRGAQREALAGGPARVEGIWGRHSARLARVSDLAGDLAESYDAVLVTTKSFATEAMLACLRGRLTDVGVAISLQNGLGNVERLAGALPARRVLAGRVIFGARIDEPGLVEVTVEAEPVLVGVPGGGASDDAAFWAGLFDAAGINCRASEDIDAALWAKVFYNAALNPMGALLGRSYGELAADPLLRRVMGDIVGEAFAVARAEGVGLPWKDAAAYLEHFDRNLVPPTARHRSSMLQDLERGRPTEIDAICGEVCRRAEAHGLDAPTHRMLHALVEGRSPAKDPQSP